jgi:hypothetical protein
MASKIREVSISIAGLIENTSSEIIASLTIIKTPK